MKHATNCKFCKRPITLDIDDAYAELGDPMKLIQLAACNNCAGLRERRRKLEDAIAKVAAKAFQSGPNMANEMRLVLRASLEALSKKYTALIAEWVGSSTPWWDEEIVNFIMDYPNQCGEALSRCWKMYEPANA